MPTNRRPRRNERRERYEGLTRGLKRCLLHGSDFFEKPSLETLRDAWQEHGDELLADWIANHPGSRPFGAWLFDIVPKFGERRTTPFWESHEPYRASHLKYGILATHTWPAMQETECVFLERNGLLTEAEIHALNTEA